MTREWNRGVGYRYVQLALFDASCADMSATAPSVTAQPLNQNRMWRNSMSGARMKG